MNQFEEILGQLQASIQKKVYDQSLITRLNSSFEKLKYNYSTWNSFNINYHSKLIFRLYQLSCDCYINFDKANQQSKQFEMIIKIRILAFQLLQILIKYLNSNYQQLGEIGLKNFYNRAFQITVTTVRICLDYGNRYVSFVKQFIPQMKFLFQNIEITENNSLLYLYLLNDLEICKYEIDNKFILETFYEKLKKLFAYRHSYYQQLYKQYIQFIILEVCIKLLKKQQNIECLVSYLNEKYLKALQGLYSLQEANQKNNNMTNIKGVTTNYFQLYTKVRSSGFKCISDQNLKNLLIKNWNEKGFFEILAQKYQQALIPLKIWYNILNSNANKNNIFLIDAYKSFISIIDCITEKSQNNNIEQIVSLAKQVLVSILALKKYSEYPITPVIKRVIKILVETIMMNFDNETQIIELFQKTNIVIKKLGYPELSKDLYAIICYYLIIRESVKIDNYYPEFIKIVSQSNQLKKIITLGYKLNKELFVQQSEYLEMIRQKPFITLLFLKKKGVSIYLDLSLDIFAKLSDQIDLYCLILKKQPSKKIQLADHFVKFIQYTKIQQLVYENQQLEFIKQNLLIDIEEQTNDENTYRLSIGSLYCLLLGYAKQIKFISNCKQLKFQYQQISQIMNMLIKNNQLIVKQQLIKMSAYVLLKALVKSVNEKLKNKNYMINNSQYQFYMLIYELIKKYNTLDANTLQYLKFIIFQIQILSNNNNTTIITKMIIQQKDLKLLQLYNTFPWIPINIKYIILREIVLNAVLKDQPCSIKLSDLKQLILLTQDIEQKKTYIIQMILVGGQQGRRFIQLLAKKHKYIVDLLK